MPMAERLMSEYECIAEELSAEKTKSSCCSGLRRVEVT